MLVERTLYQLCGSLMFSFSLVLMSVLGATDGLNLNSDLPNTTKLLFHDSLFQEFKVGETSRNLTSSSFLLIL